MTLNEYQDKASQTAIYPKEMGVVYTLLGLGGEVGELEEKTLELSFSENNYNSLSEDIINDLIHETGDIMWYISNLSRELNLKLSDIYTEEIHKNISDNNNVMIHVFNNKNKMISIFLISSKMNSIVGKMDNDYKKVIRDLNGIINEDKKQKLINNLSNILWCVNSMCIELDTTLTYVMQKNIDKLFDRMERNKIGGDGDNR